MLKRTFTGECVSWDYWECDTCGFSANTNVPCPCDLARIRRWRTSHRIRRRAAGRGVPAREIREWTDIIAGDPCSYCGARSEVVDHVVPVRFGGTSSPDNLAPACRACNWSKGARHVLAFLLGTETR